MTLPKKEDRKKDPYIFFTQEVLAIYREMARRRESNYYGATDQWFYRALKKYPIKRKHGIIFGSEKPWYEAICLEHGVKTLTIAEYNVPDVSILRLHYIHYDEIDPEFKYDFAVSISTFEHSGLGRYGDPINPNGDLEAMDITLAVLKPKALLYLAVPCTNDGSDEVIEGRERLYGKKRLPKMFKGWKFLDRYGHPRNVNKWKKHQPVFVLQKP